MDTLLLLAPTKGSIGYIGRGDFAMAADGRLTRRGEHDTVPFVYAGAAILQPAPFVEAPESEFPLTEIFDRVAKKGRLFGLPLDGLWMHVGTLAAIDEAEGAIKASAG
jgi:MurNAc alpha-1-phosphate uridylyltransferase